MTEADRPPEFDAAGSFAPHGSVRVEVRPGYTLSHVRGPWNLELVQAWIAAFGEHRAELLRQAPQGGHAAIIVVEHSAMATPEALALMRKVTQFTHDHRGLRLGAWVLPEGIEGRQLAGKALAPVWQGLVPYRMFHTLAPAVAWVRQTLG